MSHQAPSLFGLKNSNRDFSLKGSWGKNQFNSSFPAALGCYMGQQGLPSVFLKLDDRLEVVHSALDIGDLYRIDPASNEAFFSFESEFSRYLPLVGERLPRIDLVLCRRENGVGMEQLRGLEIKLTAVPDEQTYDLAEPMQGSEIVVRPDTIVYLALSIATHYQENRSSLDAVLRPLSDRITDWSSHVGMMPFVAEICDVIDRVLLGILAKQQPLLMQPVWRTRGKSHVLDDNCLDLFVWSDCAFTRLFIDVARRNTGTTITRHMRTAIWLLKMLDEFALKGKINHAHVIDSLTFDTKNDKAFSVGGSITRRYMKGEELLKPRVKRREIRNIILGHGERMLSPERRFDAAILSSLDIFSHPECSR